MKPREFEKYLVRQIELANKRASIEVAKALVEEIKRNTASSQGFGDDPFKQRLSIMTIRKKEREGTYQRRGYRSTLRDSDHSIEKLRHGTVGNRGIIDFRSTGKGELFYAHHYGKKAPSPFEPFTAQRSIVPTNETSIPQHIHLIAARILSKELKSKGMPRIRIINRKADTGASDWRNDVTY